MHAIREIFGFDALRRRSDTRRIGRVLFAGFMLCLPVIAIGCFDNSEEEKEEEQNEYLAQLTILYQTERELNGNCVVGSSNYCINMSAFRLNSVEGGEKARSYCSQISGTWTDGIGCGVEDVIGSCEGSQTTYPNLQFLIIYYGTTCTNDSTCRSYCLNNEPGNHSLTGVNYNLNL